MTVRMCGTCYYANDSKDIGRCFYCKSVYDDTGDWCEWETDYIGRMEAIKNVIDQLRVSSSEECLRERLLNLRPADVLPRDEAIKMGAELAAMHGYDATSQQLEEAYFKGVEDGMTRRDVRPVVRGRWLPTSDANKKRCSRCDVIHLIAQYPHGEINYCPNCGAKMEGN